MEKGWVGLVLTEPDELTESLSGGKQGQGIFCPGHLWLESPLSLLECPGHWMFPRTRQFHGLPYKQSQGLFMMLDFIDLCLL